jgi:regulator of sigma E protease
MLGQDDNPAATGKEMERSRTQTAGHPLPHGDLPAEPTSDAPIQHDPRSYLAKSVPQRMAIISAGVIMNVIFAFLMAVVAYMIGVKEVPCIIGTTVPGGAAWRAGLRSGDEIVQLGNIRHPSFTDVQQDVPVSDLSKGIKVVVKRPGVEEPLSKTLFPSTELGVPMIGMSSASELTLIPKTPVREDSAASEAKPALEGGDRIVSIDGQPVTHGYQLIGPMIVHASETLHLGVDRPAAEAKKPAGKDAQAVERLEVDVPTSPMKTLGLVMKMAAISGIQADSPASEAGIEVGDEFVSIDGHPIADPITLPLEMHRRMGQAIQVTVARFEQAKRVEKTFPMTLRKVDWLERPIGPGQPISIPELGIAYHVLNEVVSVVPGSPAAKADIHAGDRVASALLLPTKEEAKEGKEPNDDAKLTFDKRPNWAIFATEVLQAVPSAVRLEIQSGNTTRTVDLEPVDSTEWFEVQRGFNLAPVHFTLTADSFGDAVELAGRKTVNSLLLVYRFLKKLGGQIPVTAIGGPVAIAGEAARQAKEGMGTFLLFLTMLSANLAVINFLPIPVLDGGHMVFLAIEGIRRKPVSERIVVAFHYVGFVFLVSLMLFVLGLDLGFISRVAK